MLVATHLPHTPGLCSALGQAIPASAASTRLLHRLLTVLSLPVAAPLMPTTAHADAAGECGAVLSWFMIGCGAVLPLLAQAAGEARLFAAHQAARRRASQPPETGTDATLYEAVWTAGAKGNPNRLALATYLLLAAIWNACAAWFALASPA